MASTYLLEFTGLALAHFLALLSPGPDFFLITGNSVRHGLRGAAGICAGIAAANGLYILLALVGFGAIRDRPWIFLSMKFAGALYLIYLGFMLLRSRSRKLFNESDGSGDERPSCLGRQFAAGFASGILNPKNALFYLSLFSLLVNKETPTLLQSLYGFWMFGLVLLWDLFIAWSIGSDRVRRMLNAQIHRIEQGAGIVLLTMGGSLFFT